MVLMRMSSLQAACRRALAVVACCVLLCGPAAAAEPVHHRLEVRIDPATGQLSVKDSVRLPATSATSVRFSLAAAFEPTVDGGRLHPLDGRSGDRLRRYRLELERVPAEITLSYTGRIAEFGRRATHGMPVAVVDAQGAYLDAAAGWYPRFDDRPMTFELDVDAPPGWQVVSQGARESGGTGWRAVAPQDDIYLIAGPFERYARRHRGYDLEVYLLAPDEATAGSYLDVMGQYLDLYSALIADYPYPKFAVVENRWQTGYGMPSFTLLGSRVLRLPFILYSSLPHEILHNWWGNGVYVDYAGGNWSEGLTAYLADHLLQEEQGGGARYRRQALERYANFAAEGRDFPLREFRSRHSDASQAVGYGKAMMLFHMARTELGDPAFVAGLKGFWEAFRYRAAGFADLKGILEQTAGQPVRALADTWLDRPGAPRLALAEAAVTPLEPGGHAMRFSLRQTQDAAVYPLRVPVAVQLAGQALPEWRFVELAGREATVDWHFERPPQRLDVDPGYEVFRLLEASERPAALARLFGARVQWLVLPGDAAPSELTAWRALAGFWRERYGNVRVRLDRELDDLPGDGAVWLLGWDNRWLRRLGHRFAAVDQALDPEGLTLGGRRYRRAGFAVVALDPDNARPPLGFAGAPPDGIAALGRKLPHYGSYGRLVFTAEGLENLVKQDLAVPHSPLSRTFVRTERAPPGPRGRPLTDLVGTSLQLD
jgi:aminopeptidase N